MHTSLLEGYRIAAWLMIGPDPLFAHMWLTQPRRPIAPAMTQAPCAARVPWDRVKIEGNHVLVEAPTMRWWRERGDQSCRIAMQQGRVSWDSLGRPHPSAGGRLHIEERVGGQTRVAAISRTDGHTHYAFTENGTPVDSVTGWRWVTPLFARVFEGLNPPPVVAVSGRRH